MGDGRHDEGAAGCTRLHQAGDGTGFIGEPFQCGGLRLPIDALFREIGAKPKIAYETEEDTVVAGMAAAGFGIAVVPDHPVLRCLDVKILPITDPDPSRTAYLCRKRSAQLPAAACRFYDFCAETLGGKNS